MNRSFFAALLILAGYLYGTTLYDPWYFYIQEWLVKIGLLKMPAKVPPTFRLMGGQMQIVLVSLAFIALGVWLFIYGNN